MVEMGCPADAQDVVGYTALFHASLHDPQLPLVELLIALGADVNHQNAFGCTPIQEVGFLQRA